MFGEPSTDPGRTKTGYIIVSISFLEDASVNRDVQFLFGADDDRAFTRLVIRSLVPPLRK